MRCVGLVATVALTAIALPSGAAAVVLVNAHGRPIGGQWQRWAQRSYAPTYSGRVELTFRRCGTSGAWGYAWYADTNIEGSLPVITIDTHLAPFSAQRGTLYHELGHVYDVRVLSERSRVAFKAIWSTREAWWSTDGFAAGEWFAEGYRLCSLHAKWTATAATAESYSYYYAAQWGSATPPWAPTPPVPPAQAQSWALAAQTATCRLIRSQAHGRTKTKAVAGTVNWMATR